MEPLAYYFNLTPNEFWNATYRQVNTYIQAQIIKILDDFKRNIQLDEAVTNKLIRADSMSKKPKVIPLRETFKNLFKN